MAKIEISDALHQTLLERSEEEGVSVETLISQYLELADAQHGAFSSLPSLSERRRIARIAETVPYMLYVFDLAHGRNIFVNNYTETFFGMSFPEMQEYGQQLYVETIHPDDLNRFGEFTVQWETASDDDVFEKEYRLRRVDGQYRWIHSYESVLDRDVNGLPARIIGTALDVTDRKEMELRIEQDRRRFHAIFDNALNAILLANDAGQYIDANPAACKLLGYEYAELVGLSVWDITATDDLSQVTEQWDEFGRSGIQKGEYPLKHRNGQTVTVEFQASSDILPGVHLSIMHDISERMQIEQALRESEARYRTLFNGTPNAITVYDENGRILMINDPAAAQFGTTVDQAIGCSLADFMPERHHTYINHFHEVLASGKVKFVEDQYEAEETRRWLWVAIQPVFTDHQLSREVQVIAYDITELKQAEQLEKEHAQLQLDWKQEHDLANLRSKLIRIISHEFRTPLAIIMSASQILSRYHERLSRQERDAKIQKIEAQVRHLDHLINEITELSRANQGFLEYKPISTSLADLCETVVEDLQDMLQDNHTLNITLADSEARTRLDPKLMRHALTNLLQNAIKYSPDGGVIELSVTYALNQWQFIVRDEGIGIPEAEHDLLFKPFSRASNVDNIGGTGLGLSIVKQIIDKHNGRVYFESQIGNGSTFVIILPADSEVSLS